jgi:two-component system sensor histidine kinase UhpB
MAAMSDTKINALKGQKNNRLLEGLSRLPIFYRVLIANSAIIFVGATGGTWLATQLDRFSYIPLVIFVTVGWLVSVALNFVLLQIAFRPMIDLGKVMSRIQRGERTLRAPIPKADALSDQLASTLNTMLEAIDEANRHRATQIINAQEEERKRVARELHDETSQVLTSLLISLAVLEETITSPEARDRIAETRQLAHQTLRAIRSISIDLRPSALDDLGLLPALRWYIKEYQQKFGIEVDFQATGIKERFTSEIETAFYRIVQESLTNIARHANAQKVCIILNEQQDTIDATIVDNGNGFDVEKLLKKPATGQERGWGLVGMLERAQLLDGNLHIESLIGKGTTIHIHIPVQLAPSDKAVVTAQLTE